MRSEFVLRVIAFLGYGRVCGVAVRVARKRGPQETRSPTGSSIRVCTFSLTVQNTPHVSIERTYKDSALDISNTGLSDLLPSPS